MSNILIVDDKEENRYLLQTILTAAGHATREAANGADALESARRDHPDLIISDSLMPQMDGFALCRECKRDETLRDIPFVFYTATYTDPRDRDLALRLGAARFAVKPMEAGEISAIVEEVLKEHTQGKSSASVVPAEDETALYRLYNEALVRKLEDKMLALEKEIAERKQAEAQVAANERRFRAMTEKISDAIVLLDSEGKLIYRSESGAGLFGYSDEEVLGRSAIELIHPDELSRVAELFAHLAESPRESVTTEFRYKHKNGNWLFVETSATNLLEDPDVKAIIANLRDITARKQAERELELQLERLHALHSIDLAISGSMDLSTNLDYILSYAVSLLNADAADILVAAPHAAEFQIAAGCGFRTRDIKRASVPFRNSLAGAAALQRQIVRLSGRPGAETNREFSAMWNQEGFVSYICVPLFAKGVLKGAFEIYKRSRFDPDPQWNHFLETVAGQVAIAIDNSQMFIGLQQSNIELSLAYEATIEGWSRAMDLRDKETEGHTLRVTNLTLNLAQAMGISEPELTHVRRGALLHDMGKMGVPDPILLKPGKLTDEEWVIMKKHPQFAYDMLSPIDYLKPALDIPYCHHEKWDGSGYPRGLKGEEIPLSARLFAIVDVWDALTSDRPYRPAWTLDNTAAHIREQSGKHFDPKVVDIFLQMMKDAPDNGIEKLKG